MASDRFVSRGGDKLQAALEQFQVDPIGLTALDVGSSTGGFVDCLLQAEAAKIYALDTAYGEFSWKLRQDPRVVVMERTNILHIETLPEKVDLVTIDAGWTRLELVLPVVARFLKPEGAIIALVKPHYQSQGKGLEGGVLSKEAAEQMLSQLKNILESDWQIVGEMESPILGGAGNTEYLIYLKPAI